MKKACIVVSSCYLNNKIFDLEDKEFNRDNCMYPFFLLRDRLREMGIDLATSDIYPPDDAEFVLYNEMPKRLPSKSNINKSFLMLFESQLIRPDNWDKKKHAYFRKVFTWRDDFIDDKKYFKINFPQEIYLPVESNLKNKEKLCTLIAGNKLKAHPLELYSKRVDAIRWFENNHPEDFEFYGFGWEKFTTSNRYLNFILSKFPAIQKYLANSYKTYRGSVISKRQTLPKYKFAICYENARDIPGYITEKIIDCLMAGCIPIYWGANNITEYVPSQCFIDKRAFDTYEALYAYISTMNDEVYNRYLEHINIYLNSERSLIFSADYFVQTLLSELLCD